MNGELKRCDECGMTSIKYDPPRAVKNSEACGAVLPGNYSSAGRLKTVSDGLTVIRDAEPIPTCCLAEDHEGEHIHWAEMFVRWSP